MANEREPEVIQAVYISGDGPKLRIPREAIIAMIAIADGASEPGAPVSPSDLVNEAIKVYLADKSKALRAIAKADEEAELERVAAVHGGGEAA